MKRPLHTILALSFFCAAGYFVFSQYKESISPLRKAAAFEFKGQFQDAYNQYTQALIDITPSMELPNLNKSKVVDPSIWKKDLIKYVEWVCLPSQVPKQFDDVLNSINKCSKSNPLTENRIVQLTVSKLPIDSFISEWKSNFYALTATIESSHIQIAKGAHLRNVSILKLSANKGFTYNIHLVNLSSGKQSTATIFSEGTASLLVYPGDHLLVCKSTVAFSSGEVWNSSNTIIPIAVPQKASMISGTLITKVSRQKIDNL